MKHTTTQFDFSAKPKVTTVKPKYRDRDEYAQSNNMMNDPRIVRGNTYAAVVENKNEIKPPPLKKKAPAPQKKYKQRRINFDTGFEPTTPRAVNGRDHFTTQTEPFVETLRDKPIQYEKESQTDLFLDRPVERLFNPMDWKIGQDRSTQIQENDPDLFDFNYEVQPIVDALLNKVVQTSRMELYEEKLLKQKEKQKIDYEKKRHARLVQAQMIQANEDRLREQYDRRHLQYRKSKEQQSYAEKKVISRMVSKQYLKNLKQNTQIVLQHEGYFRNAFQNDLYQKFVPWLYSEIDEEIYFQETFLREAHEITSEGEKDFLQNSEEAIKKQHSRRQQIQNAQRKRIQEKRAQKQRKKQEQQQKKKMQEEAEKNKEEKNE